MKNPFKHPDDVTAQFRLLGILQRQRKARGFGNTSADDLNTEAEIIIRLSEAQYEVGLNIQGEQVKKSIERG